MARGTIRQRGPTSWELRIYVGYEDGRRRYLSKTVRGTHKDAERALTKLQHEVDIGEAKAPAQGTVATFLEEWWKAFGPDLYPSTRVTTRSILDKHLIPGLGTYKVTQLEVKTIDTFYAGLKRAGYAPATIHRIHQTLHRALEVARTWHIIGRNPATAASPGPMPRRIISPVDPSTVTQVVKSPKIQPEFARYLRVAAATGGRPGELCALQVRDVDFDKGVMHIRRRVTRGNGLEVIDLTKNGRTRVVGIGSGTAAVLREQMAGKGATEFIFGGVQPMDPALPSKRWARLRKELGVTGRLYDVRHGSITALLGAGVDINTISIRVGHARPSTTLDYYGGVIPGADDKAAMEVDRLLG